MSVNVYQPTRFLGETGRAIYQMNATLEPVFLEFSGRETTPGHSKRKEHPVTRMLPEIFAAAYVRAAGLLLAESRIFSAMLLGTCSNVSGSIE